VRLGVLNSMCPISQSWKGSIGLADERTYDHLRNYEVANLKFAVFHGHVIVAEQL
jgi:hypothetical protein